MERQQIPTNGSNEQKRRARISVLLKKLSVLQTPKEPDTKMFLLEKEAIESRMATLVKHNAQLLAIQCTRRVN
ncbi:hypothetical protein [Arsenicibacter rosenii]|nr:hypothetical protein [Arsenicibacter rosenii]